MINSILEILNTLSFFIAMVGVLIIFIGSLNAFFLYLLNKSFLQIRLVLVKHILLGLDFLIAHDIVNTVLLKPDKTLWMDLAALALIVLIRVLFSYFANREMEELVDMKSLDFFKNKKAKKKN